MKNCQQAQGKHHVNVKHGIGNPVSADVADDQDDRVQVMVGNLQYVRTTVSQ